MGMRADIIRGRFMIYESAGVKRLVLAGLESDL